VSQNGISGTELAANKMRSKFVGRYLKKRTAMDESLKLCVAVLLGAGSLG
jgi:hypothetical protein